MGYIRNAALQPEYFFSPLLCEQKERKKRHLTFVHPLHQDTVEKPANFVENAALLNPIQIILFPWAELKMQTKPAWMWRWCNTGREQPICSLISPTVVQQTGMRQPAKEAAYPRISSLHTETGRSYSYCIRCSTLTLKIVGQSDDWDSAARWVLPVPVWVSTSSE